MTKEIKFEKVIKKLMKDNKLSQRKLADKANCSQEIVNKWVNHGVFPSLLSLIELAAAFDVTLDYLVYGDENV